LAGRPLAPLHLRREHPGLGEHAVGHGDTVNLAGVQLANDPSNENPCATSDVGYLAGAALVQRRNHFALRRPIHPMLKNREVI
jgi:hypothetical protein